MRPPKKSPEEERLLTLARIYAEHPDNNVAERKLLEAAVEFARTRGVSGRAAPFNPFAGSDPFTGGWADWVDTMRRQGTGVRPASKENTAAYKEAKRRAEKEHAERTAERKRRAEEQERKADDHFKRTAQRDAKDDDYPF